MSTFIFDSEQLSSIASEPTVREGLQYFKENRVIECFVQEEILFALVEGKTFPEQPYSVELSYTAEGELSVSCQCSNNSEVVCKHAIAALLGYSDDVGSQDANLQTAMEAAINDRIKRGRTEVQVKHLSGHPSFGIWQAFSIDSYGQPQRRYEVHIRSLQEKINFCTCPDRANNQLGTCKHIEAVIFRLGKDKTLSKGEFAPPIPFVFSTWEGEDKVKIQRTKNLRNDLSVIIDRFFDGQGYFKGELPEEFFEFQSAVYGRDDITIGIDAKWGVERIAAQQKKQLRATQLERRIKNLNGHLPGLKAKLYPYQIEGVAFLSANGRSLLADDMGLGKTLQAIAAAGWLIEEQAVQRVLIVSPASLKHQWAREIEKFTDYSVQIVQGNAATRQAQYRQDKTFFILNYELILRDLSVINERLTPDLLILDEAQRIKNWRTKIATSVKQIGSKYAFVLTGTPLENRLEDLYSLMQVVDQHLLGPLWRYLNDYHITDDAGKVLGYRNLSELRQKIRPVMLRRNRAIVSDQLPNRITTRLDVAMSPRQQELHDSGLATASRLAKISKNRPLTPSEQNKMMAALQTARMACNAAGLVDKETEGSPKLTELKTLVQELCIEAGRKMVIFSQWRGMTLMIEALLAKMKVGYVHLNGQVPTAKRGKLMDRFNGQDDIAVFISTDAGGSGLNLQAASVLVNMDIPWNPAVLEQRNARIHRLGQENKVQIILMVAEESYEERVLQLVGNKQHLFDNVVDPEAAEDVIGITRKSIAAVIEDLTNQEALSAMESGEKDATLETEEPFPNHAENDAISSTSNNESEQDVSLRKGIEKCQSHFGSRLVQIMVRNGGLLLILDKVEDEDDAFVDQVNLPAPVATIDIRTLRQFNKLGEASPLADAQIYADHSVPSRPERIWLAQAKEKLNSARILFEHNSQENSDASSDSSIMELLSSAAGAYVTDRANSDQLISVEETPVWIYSKGIPEEKISEQHASSIMRVLGMRFSNQIPADLVRQSFNEMQSLIEQDQC